MIIQITGTGTGNKGAELLLVSAQQRLRELVPHARLAVPASFGSWEDRARYGLQTVLPEYPKGRWWLTAQLMPIAFRSVLGLVLEREVDVILDASGFAFGDQLGVDRIRTFSKDVIRWKRQGKLVILLSQAFGPFENSEIRAEFSKIVSSVDLIFAREAQSFNFVKQLGVSTKKLRIAPDFTNLVKPLSRRSADTTKYSALLVPNFQMIAKADKDSADQYIPFLARCYEHLSSIGMCPAILLHDDRVDAKLIPPLHQKLGRNVPVITADDPLELKYIIGQAQLVIGSRFHALVSALSQGVPTIAAGWSHKYETLLQDYHCEDALLTSDADDDMIASVISRVHGDILLRLRLAEAGTQLRINANDMWDTVTEAIRDHCD